MIGNLGLKIHVTAVGVVLQGEVSLESLLDARDPVDIEQGLLVPFFSSLSGI